MSKQKREAWKVFQIIAEFVKVLSSSRTLGQPLVCTAPHA